MIRITELKLKQICSVFVVMLPVLTMYKSPIPFLDLGSFFMILLLIPVVRFTSRRSNGIFKICGNIWVIYLFYIAAITIISAAAGRHFNSVPGYCIRMIKNIIYILFTIFLYQNSLFSYKLAIRPYKKMAGIATIYIIIQYICYRLFNYGLPGYIPSLVYTEGYAERAGNITSAAMFRPTSLFYEPAHYFEFVCLALIFCLIYSEKRKDFMLALFIMLGVLISTSGQGIVFSVFIWGMWMLKNMMRISRRGKTRIAAVCVMFFIIGAYLLGSAKGRQIINRLVGSGDSGNAIAVRAQGFIRLKELTPAEILFGCGYANYPGGFFSSWSFNLWCLGIIGTSMAAIIYLQCFIKTKLKAAVILNVLMGVFSTVFMGYSFVFNFSFILAGKTEDCTDERKKNSYHNRFCLSQSDYEWDNHEEPDRLSYKG